MNETITVVGNVGSTPERREIGAGASVTSFRLGCTERRFDKQSGSWVDGHTNWYTVSAFRALGENVLRSLNRGERVVVVGRLRLREWETETKKGVSADIVADAVGHDLLWGTSSFARAAGGESSAPRVSEAAREVAADTPAGSPGDWGAPATPVERAERAEMPAAAELTPF